MRRPLSPVPALLAALVALLLPLLAAAPSGAAAPTPGAAPGPTASAAAAGRYVALGDSFSAGSGILPIAPGSNPLCLRTSLNYPSLLAARTGLPTRDVTCGAATTGDFYTAQYPGLRPQLDAVTADTTLVTVGIGGNNEGVFIDVLTRCAKAGLSTLGFGSPCRDRYGSRFVDTINALTYPAVRQALLDVKARAPQARVAVLGYPRIVPESGGCFARMPIARGDIGYVNEVEQTLNGVIARAAAETGTTFVDLWGPSTGRDACQSVTRRWVEPLVLGTNFVPVHPNAAGEAAMAAEVARALGL